MAFSGVLSYQELFGSVTETCPAPGAPGTMLGYPACIYGFFMYTIVSAAALWGLVAGRSSQKVSRPPVRTSQA